MKSPPKRYNANAINLDGIYPYVVRTSENNGIKGYTTQEEKYLCEGGTISFGQDTATIFFQENPYFTGDKIKVVKCRDKELNPQIASYLLAVMRKSFSSFTWGVSSFNENALNSVKIILPITADGSVDYEYMQKVIEIIENDLCLNVYKFLDSNGFSDCTLTVEENNALADLAMNNKQMKRIKIVDAFTVANTHNILKSEVVFDSGTVPYVTASENYNSVSSYISYNEALKESGNTIMIGGKTLVITYQPRDFFSNDSHNLTLAISDERGRTESAQLFMVAALYKSLKPIYSWGNSISKAKIQKDYVDFPVSSDGYIDYDFMETYVNAVKKQCIARLKASGVFAHSRNSLIQKELKEDDENSNILIYDYSEVSPFDRHTRFLPFYSIKAACGPHEFNFSDEGLDNDLGWIDASEFGHQLNKNMFVIKAVGHSMEPRINDGDYCVFEWYTPDNAGSREGKIVLAKDITEYDDDYSGRFTIKKYHRVSENLVELQSINAGHPTFILEPNGEYASSNPILAVFIGVLKIK